MTLEVLQTNDQIDRARDELKRRGLSALDSPLGRILRKIKLKPTGAVGDKVKSWDVLRTIEFLEQYVPKDGTVLDIGAWSSEILSALHRLGYTNLAGVDLNPALLDAPHADTIRYEIADFMQTPFADQSLDAITAISVIEHGFDSERLLREVARLLRAGGFFVASFDYWPQKVDTSEHKIFDMDWLIFSEQDVRSFVASAAAHWLVPTGPLAFSAATRPVEYAGRQYTFGWLVMQKS